MPPRTFAIGDIHGCSIALDTILEAICPRSDDTIVTLGDYVDRGIDSKGVLDRLIALRSRCTLIPLLGNHDRLFLDAIASAKGATASDFGSDSMWRAVGGIATLQSYGDIDHPGDIPADHVRFLKSCRLYHETETHLFIHANYDPEMPMPNQREGVLLWESLRVMLPGPHVSGKIAVVGHTSQKTGEVLDLGHVKCIDTFCYGGKWLTAMDVDSGEIWQANESGRLRR